MSEKTSKWRKTNTPTKRYQNIAGAKKELPEKFRPTRDRSESVDKIFNGSRSRVNSEGSIEVSQLNNTRLEEGGQGGNPICRFHDKREEMMDSIKKQVFRLNSLDLSKKQSINPRGMEAASNTGQLLLEIKRQFNHFKQNVLNELQRQKQLINQLIKEVILTLQFQLDKLGRKSQVDDLSCLKTNNSTSFSVSQPKTIEHWKNTLRNVDFTQRKSHTMNNAFVGQLSKTISTQNTIPPPKTHLDINSLIGGISNLKTKVNEMEKIIQTGEISPKFSPEIDKQRA